MHSLFPNELCLSAKHLCGKNSPSLNLCVKGARRAERLAATPWKEPHGSAPWRKFRIGRTVDVAPEFLWWLWSEVRCRVDVGLPANDHTNVRVQVNSARLAGHESKTKDSIVTSRMSAIHSQANGSMPRIVEKLKKAEDASYQRQEQRAKRNVALTQRKRNRKIDKRRIIKIQGDTLDSHGSC